MKNIQLEINESGLIKNLGAIFTDRTKVLIELAQNARRAGSNSVNFTYDSELNILTVEDSGCGIADMQNLLSVALSGWGKETNESESAYGMGFLATLFSCSHIEVVSQGCMISCETADILNQKSISVMDADIDIHSGVRITLTDFNMDEKSILKALEKLALGYSIFVRFNGECLARPNCLEVLKVSHEAQEFEFGTLYIRNHSFKTAYNCYLQGVHILSCHHNDNDQGHIYVHLNNHVKARMPDRDKLLNEDVIRKAITSSIKEFFINKLKALQSDMEDKEFVEQYGDVTLSFCPKLFNNSNYLPAKLFSTVGEYPTLRKDWEDCYTTNSKSLVSKDDVINGVITLVSIDLPSSSESFLPITYIWLKELVIIDSYHSLDKTHWVFEHINDMGEEGEESGECDVTIELNGECKKNSHERSMGLGKRRVC